MTAAEISDLLHRVEAPGNLLALHLLASRALSGDARALQELARLKDTDDDRPRTSIRQVR